MQDYTKFKKNDTQKIYIHQWYKKNQFIAKFIIGGAGGSDFFKKNFTKKKFYAQNY
jgi:hypothetical protein